MTALSAAGPWRALLLALAAALILTPLVRWLALAVGFVDQPRDDRHHTIPTPYLGGLAVMLALLAALLLSGVLAPHGEAIWAGQRTPTKVLTFVAIGSFLLGLADDWRRLAPPVKLAGQVAITTLFMAVGGAGPSHAPSWDGLVGLVWVIGLMNACNFVDNMDGVLAGLTAIAALGLAALGLWTGAAEPAGWLMALAGAALGFLAFNRPPARIFLGDAGSLLAGGALAAGAWSVASGSARLTDWIALPLILAYPIFDITFVTVTRLARRQGPWIGGRDHTTHRLATWMGGGRRALGVVYAAQAAGAAAGLLAARLEVGAALGVLAGMAVLFGWLGLRLARVPVS